MGVPTVGGESFYRCYVASSWVLHTGKSMIRACRWVHPPCRVTFDPSHVLPWAWQEVKCEAVSVNEADYQLEFAGSRGERKAARWVWLCIAPPIHEMRLDVVWAVLYLIENWCP